MIVRISRATVKPNSESAAFQILREAVQAAPRPAGLEAVFISRRMANAGDELLAISVWQDLDSMVAVMSDDWQRPRFLPSLDSLIVDASVDHYETIAADFEALKSIGT